jgi:hypothetical protein
MLKLAPRPALLLTCLLLLLPGAASAKTAAPRPVLVELFTSQGCSACVAANALMGDLAARKDALALTFPVDYWDYLGWKDTFAKPAFAARQRAYQKALGLRDVYTPQLVVDGAAQTTKTSPDKALEWIEAAAKDHREPAPSMRISHGQLIVGPGRFPAGGVDVWLVRYQPRPQETAVKDGENRGVTVVYSNVATDLVRLGGWAGRKRRYTLPKTDDGDLKSAVLLQATATGRILEVLKR